jgi:GxxExxY protein
MLVNHWLVVELKTVESLLPLHTAQMISYLRATRCELGLLSNFDVPLLKKGVRRVILSGQTNVEEGD